MAASEIFLEILSWRKIIVNRNFALVQSDLETRRKLVNAPTGKSPPSGRVDPRFSGKAGRRSPNITSSQLEVQPSIATPKYLEASPFTIAGISQKCALHGILITRKSRFDARLGRDFHDA